MSGTPPDIEPRSHSTAAHRPTSEPAPAPQGPRAMNGVSLQRKLLVTNPQGFHMRPMAAFAETALRFQSRVTVARTGYEADGKSPLSLMGLAAQEGTELLLQVTGPDAQAALNALLELLTSLSVAAEVEDQKSEVRG